MLFLATLVDYRQTTGTRSYDIATTVRIVNGKLVVSIHEGNLGRVEVYIVTNVVNSSGVVKNAALNSFACLLSLTEVSSNPRLGSFSLTVTDVYNWQVHVYQ